MTDADQEKVLMDLQNLGNRQRSLRSSLKLCLYEVLLCLFNSSNDPAKISDSKKFSYVFLNLFQAVQMISILSVAENSISLWSSYGPLWDILQYLRVDFVLCRLGFSFFFSILVQASILLSVLFFLLLLALVFYGRRFPSFLRKTTSSFFALYSSFFPIPCAIVLLSNSFFFFAEKHTSPLSSVFNSPLALLCLVFFLLINLLYIVATSESRHSFSCLSLDSKSSCVLDLRTLQIRVVILTFYVLRGASETFYLSMIMFFGEGMLSLQFFFQKPYFNEFANKTKVGCCLIVSLSGLAMAMGTFTDNAGVFVLIAYVANPLIVACSLWIISEKIATKPSESCLEKLIERPRHFRDSLEVERILRPYLVKQGRDQETKERILSAFDAFFYTCTSKDSQVVVWEANFCLSSLKDERLSRIKLSKRMYCKFSFEGDFQAFSFLKRLQTDNDRYFQDFDFLQFRLRLQQNKVCDQQICRDFLFLMEKLTELSPPFKVVSVLLSRISETLTKVNKEYDDLCGRYSQNKELLDLYHSFLSDIMRDREKAIFIQQKHGQNQMPAGRELNWFDEKNSLLIVSGSVSSLGQITFANENASCLLKEPTFSILGKNIQDYIPHMEKLNHNSSLNKFLFFSKNTKIRLPRSSFLKISKGIIIEVYMKLRCLAIDSYPMFLVLFREKKKNRDLVLTDEDGNINQFSANIPSILKIKDNQLIGMNLQGFLAVHGFLQLNSETFSYTLNGYNIYYHQKKVFSQSLNIYKFYLSGTRLRKPLKLLKNILRNVVAKTSFIKKKGNTYSEQMKYLKIVHEMAEEESMNTKECKMASQTIAYRKKQSETIYDGTKKYIKILILVLVLLIFTAFSMILSDSIYVNLGFDTETTLTSLYKIWNLNNALMSISNSANNFKRTSESIYKESFLDHIQFFEKFVTNQKEIIDVFHRCDERYKIYDDRMFYWEKEEIKTINLVDFSNKFVRYSYDFFEQREMSTSFEYIVLNSNSYPMEYLHELATDLKICIGTLQDNYVYMSNIIIIGGLLSLNLILGVLVFVSLRLRMNSISYWNMLVNILSANYTKIQRSLYTRLEKISSEEDNGTMIKRFHKKNWKIPEISITKYTWLPIALSLTGIVMIYLYTSLYREYIKDTTRERINTIACIGEMNFLVQELDYWTSETMLENSSASNIMNIQPFKQPRQKLDETISKLDKLKKVLMKRKSIKLLNGETDLYFDKIKSEDFTILNGIYGAISMIMKDSNYFAENKYLDSEYQRFSNVISNLKTFQDKALFDAIGTTVDYLNDIESTILIMKSVAAVIIMAFVLIIYIPFIKQEYKSLEHKTILFEVVNSIPNNEK